MKKFKIFILLVSILMLQGICANAASSNKDEEYSKEEIENRRPGFEATDIAKSVQYINSGKNTFSASKALSVDDEEDYEVIENYEYNQIGPISEDSIVSITSISGSNDKWGKTNDGNWIYIENNSPGIGWKLVNGYWYYMNSEGIMQTGWINYKDKWYYLYSDGQMAKNTYIDYYYVDSSGVMI